MSEVKYTPGDIVELGGVKFVVLDNDYNNNGALLILTLKAQGESKFGATNDYVKSDLYFNVLDWYGNFRRCFSVTHEYSERLRVVNLTTLDGHGVYGEFWTRFAPLTLDEARKYADVIPPCDKPWWLATGWGGPGYFGDSCALVVSPSGSWSNGLCSYSYGIRPAITIDPKLLDEAPD